MHAQTHTHTCQNRHMRLRVPSRNHILTQKQTHSKHTEAQSSRATDSCPHICLKKAYSDTHTQSKAREGSSEIHAHQPSKTHSSTLAEWDNMC